MGMKCAIDFHQLDFTRLLDPNQDFAVHCSSEEQALHFIREIRRQYPKHAWDHEQTRWCAYGGGIAYSPYLNRGRRMTWDRLTYYSSRGFVIVEFEELLTDEGIEESEHSVSLLYGGVV